MTSTCQLLICSPSCRCPERPAAARAAGSTRSSSGGRSTGRCPPTRRWPTSSPRSGTPVYGWSGSTSRPGTCRPATAGWSPGPAGPRSSGPASTARSPSASSSACGRSTRSTATASTASSRPSRTRSPVDNLASPPAPRPDRRHRAGRAGQRRPRHRCSPRSTVTVVGRGRRTTSGCRRPYHLSVNCDDVDAVIAGTPARSGTQVADAPGRHQPSTGQLPIGTRWPPSTGRVRRLGGLGTPSPRAVGRQPRPAARAERAAKGDQRTTTVAFVGLGIMGAPMACNLIAAARRDRGQPEPGGAGPVRRGRRPGVRTASPRRSPPPTS